jgi:hypothetical protein
MNRAGVPHMKKEPQNGRAFSGPAPIACRIAVWSTACSSASRALGLSPLVLRGRLQVIGPDPDHAAGRVDRDEAHPRVGLQHRPGVHGRVLQVVDLARAQRRDGGGGIGHRQPLDAVDLGYLAAGEAVGLLLARHVVGIADVDRLRAGPPFLLREDEGPRPVSTPASS